MRSDLNRFILLGFICQGLSWDDRIMPLVNIGIWVLAIEYGRRSKGLGQSGDVLGMILGSAAAFALAKPLGASSHFFVGHGLTLLQASRLTRPINRREQIFSFIVALGQIGVACTVILDYRFIPVLVAGLILLPKALAEMEAARFQSPTTPAPPKARFSFATFLTLLVVLAAVFFGSPRGLISATLPTPAIGAASGDLFDDLLDPSFGGQANSSRVVMQIEGEQTGYLRLFCLSDYEDGIWRTEPAPRHVQLPAPTANMPTNLLTRSVRVKNANYLSKKLPHDGQIIAVEGNFFRRQRIDENRVVHCLSMWNTANNAYRYWISDRVRPENLDHRRQRLLTRVPALTPAVQSWLNERVAGATNSLDAARRLESWLVDNFEYRIGAPNINRLNALEEFLIREKRGHCERFASALALLLRSRGIPARVVVGFVPGPLNWFSGWRNVRFNDAHAWTEAWFPDEGWIQLDATPRADMNPPGGRLAELLDALDVMWYVNFVNYNNTAQQSLLQTAGTALGKGMDLARAHALKIVPILLIGALWRLWLVRPTFRPSRNDAKRRRIEFAEDCYGRMLRLLAAKGATKQAEQTPREFLANLPAPLLRVRQGLEQFTEEFQRIRYGHQDDDSGDAERLKTLLAKITIELRS